MDDVSPRRNGPEPGVASREAVRTVGGLILALGAIFWMAAMMDSLFSYRSPLANNPPEPGEGSGVRSTRRVVFILVDALREDTALNSR